MPSFDFTVETQGHLPVGKGGHFTKANADPLDNNGFVDGPEAQPNGVTSANGSSTNGLHADSNGYSNGASIPIDDPATHTNGTSNGVTSNGHPATTKPQPIAVIGYSCRLSGDVTTPDDLWELCTRARSGWSKIPSDRFSFDAFHHPNPSKMGAFNPTGGYFLQEDLGRFDAPFFNLTAQEAISMDPQQRLLLECSFEAFESAGIPKEFLAGRKMGVFVGGNFADYELNNVRDVETIPMYQATGCAPALQSNRISYYFDLRGPSFTVDTACSGSLVALHQAVQSLRSGESTEALVAGCKLNILPDLFVSMSMSQLFNDAGKTFAFDERATSGFARGEGAGCVILKPLDAALRDRDAIRAVIANTGVSQDGRTQGITQPSGDAQRDLIRDVYRNAGLDPADCGFAEMHGTGTKVGDPIEASAVHQALGSGRSPRNPLYIGSVKSNVGHLEGASGVISIIKASMMLEKELMLPNTNFEKANANIPLKDWNMKVLTSSRPWPRNKKYISVSNYGFGGTNAHAVLEKPPLAARMIPEKPKDVGASDDPKRKLFIISANDKESLQTRMKDLGVYFEQRPEAFEKMLCGNVAHTLGSKRSNLAYRMALSATSLDDLGIRLAQAKVNSTRVLGAPTIAFVFTGQGAQWAQMGTQLINEYPIFASTLEKADKHLKNLGASFSLVEELQKDAKTSRVNSADISQPACTAVQVALTNLLESWGIRPTAVVGHSSGEISAAYASGVYNMYDAMALAYHRGQMTLRLKERFPTLKGTMLAVGAGPDTVSPYLKTLKDGYATIACVNSPSSVTVSGDVPAILELQKVLEEKQLFNRKLMVDMAYHSDHMKRVAEEYLATIDSIKPRKSSTATFYSTVFGRVAETYELDASYWVANLTSPVVFPDGLSKLCSSEARPSILVELGPHPALKGPIKDTLKTLGSAASKIAYVPTIARNADAVESILDTAAAVYMKGANLNMNAVNFPKTGARYNSFLTDMPRYPWQHSTKYWHESRIADKHLKRAGGRNDVLGVLANYSNDLEPTWRNIVRLDDLPWLRHHAMQGMTVFPLAGYIVMAIEAAQQRAQFRGVNFSKFVLREVVVGSALVLNDGIDTETTFSLRPYTEGTRGYSDHWDEFRICSWNSKRGWSEHCRGLVGVRGTQEDRGASISRLAECETNHFRSLKARIEASSQQNIDSKRMYDNLQQIGVGYGPTFQGLENCLSDSHHCFGDILVTDTKALVPKTFEHSLIAHPAFLDIFLHTLWPILGAGRNDLDTLYMPTMLKHATINRVLVNQAGEQLKGYCTGNPSMPTPEPTTFNLFATSSSDSVEPLITYEGLVMTPIRDPGAGQSAEARKLCYKLDWQPLISDEDQSNGQADSNGRLEPNGHTNGNGESTSNVALDIVIAQFGELDSISGQLATSIETTLGATSAVGTLGDVDCAQKNVIVLETGANTLKNVTPDMFEVIKKTLLTADNVLWVYKSDNPDSQMSVGLTRTVRSETLAKIATLGIDAEDMASPITPIMHALDALWPTDGREPCKDTEFISSKSKLLVQRAAEDQEMNSFVHHETHSSAIFKQPYGQAGRRLKIQVGNPGALDTLHFVDDNAGALGDDEVEIEVKATGMNFKDIVVSMGQLAQPYIGVECSGIISSVGKNVTDVHIGQRVMAMSEGAYSTYARCLSTSVYPIPEDMSFEEASTVPVVFCTAYYGLFDLGHLAEGERVLIHAGAGGVGQAAINLAKMAGAEIYTTVGSQEKKSFLMKEYNIPEERIFYSRDTSFAASIKRVTNNEGIDVVLNSLAGDVLRETWDCMAPFGRFIEIGKADITKNSRLDMNKFEYNVTFASVDLTKVASYKPKLMKRILSDICGLMDKRTIKPVTPITTFRISEVEAAFRQLQSGKSIGKLVVVPHDNDQVNAVAPKTPSDLLSEDASYILIGGTGGLGRSMAKWMSSKGARNIVLVSRSASVNDKVKALMDELAPSGTNIVVKTCDVSNPESVEKLVKEDMKDMPPVRGVIHGAMVLKDMLFENMTHEDFISVTTSKVDGAWNLHNTLSSSPLDFFITLSSVAGVIGNRGQAAYSAANVFLDGFMSWRRSQGLPGTSIDLTAVSNVGYLAETGSGRQEEILKNIGSETIDESEVLSLLAASLTQILKHTQCVTGLAIPDPAATLDSNFWIHDPRFTSLLESAQSLLSTTSSSFTSTIPLPQLLRTTPTHATATPLIYTSLLAKLSSVLGLPIEDLDNPSNSISGLGLDSLVAIEIRNWIARETEANVQVLELLSCGSIGGLAELIAGKSRLLSGKPKE
ncbi:putative polyketide synthase [Phaeomoniella chlamydospora]|uniref:Putative polyketide synthase n=1 Tax=Phaeomoniella chlamydospora TaxID=158046 RepID=A0A0G2ECU8_PHACM|nr:putative polyketide synthase [Phaeomoniella chlamydospora]